MRKILSPRCATRLDNTFVPIDGHPKLNYKGRGRPSDAHITAMFLLAEFRGSF